MDCRHCFTQLASQEEIFFYVKASKDVHLSIKPELMSVITLKKLFYTVQESKKKVRVKCNSCNSNVGCVLPFGPNGTKFHAFAADKVKLSGSSLSSKERWWNKFAEFPNVERRDTSNFFNVLSTSIKSHDVKEPRSVQSKIKFPSLSSLGDFEWYTVSLVKKPRYYQIQAFVEALQRNVIVVIKTGAGKTLIASMLLGRMCSLNPDRMGLMIVDRIPLVFQQGEAISSDTNLRVSRICGENKTAFKMKQINGGHYDVLVVTAGAFYEMVERKDISVNLFCAVVFDECHHICGGHRYVDVLKKFMMLPRADQPRILGLTASPFSAMTLKQAENRLEKYLATLPDIKIFCPELPKQSQSTINQTVFCSNLQKEFIKNVLLFLNNHLAITICRYIGKNQMEMQSNLLNSYQLKGELRALLGEYTSVPDFDENIKLAFMLMESLEMCEIMGVPMACKVLTQNNTFDEVVNRYKDVSQLSNRLQRLTNLLTSVEKTSKILVFVSTRNVARELVSYLSGAFPNFNVGMVVGHGGYDGMCWEGEQEDMLHEFAKGNCNLLVCTSVLEEGLDVTSCDLVVGFTGVKSLIQFIQMRGRARQIGSKFIIYQSEAESCRNRDMQLEEEVLNVVLKRHQDRYCLFSVLSKDIIKKIEQEMLKEDKDLNIGKEEINLNCPTDRENDFSFTCYADNVGGDPDLVKRKLLERLEECHDFRIKRLELNTTDASLVSVTNNVFKRDNLVFVVGAYLMSTASNPNDIYNRFCRTFDFQLQFNDGSTSLLWTRRQIRRGNLRSPVEIRVLRYGIGYFINRITVNIVRSFGEYAVVKFTPKKQIDIMYTVDGLEVFITVPLASLGKFALLSLNRDDFSLTMVLMYPPSVFNEDLFAVRRLSSFSGCQELKYFSGYPLLSLTFNINEINRVREILQSPLLFPVPTFDVKLKYSENDVQTQKQDVYKITFLKDILWSLNCLQESRVVCFPRDGFVKVSNHLMSCISKEEPKSVADNVSLIEHVVNNVFSICLTSPYFSDFNEEYSNAFNAFHKLPVSRRVLLRDSIPENHFMIKRAVVTPCRILSLPATPVASNRLLRRLAVSRHELLLVSFKDEDMSKLHNIDLLPRIESVLTTGILINDIKYQYLCSSGSQLREHKAYFLASESYETVLYVRSLVIPNPLNFTSAPKYLARLGMYGTADKHIANVHADSVAWIEDGVAENGELTTDGAGKISYKKAEELTMKMDIKLPSAFQIRYSGIKGILLCTSEHDPDLNGKDIAFRKSMQKFQNNDEDLCIVSTSKIHELTLNREVITLLSAIKSDWLLNNTLMRYQEVALAKSAEIFMDGKAAQESLKSYIDKNTIDELRSCNFEILDEKYWFTILQGVYRLQVREIRNKTSIPIDKGCLLIGVPDPYGVLKDNEVFVQLKIDGKPNQLIEGPILTYRNPCLHPGDHRRVVGKRVEKLMHLYNVMVLPVNGCTHSLSSACSGGDLDGDMFAVIWDSNLIPAEELIFPPCDYLSLANSPTSAEQIDVTDQAELAKFYTKFMANDSLGRVAHKHLALCDILDDGARDPLAIELAKSQCKAVDYPKTGIPPVVPKQALAIVKETGFPDFMEKSVIYPSKKILGYLYRRCKSVTYDFDVVSKRATNILMNMNLFVQGHEKYLNDGVEVYSCYAHNMQMLMTKFELKVEADVILGCATFNWSQHYEADKGKASDAIACSYNTIIRKYREIFFSDVTDKMSQWEKASAWYRISNDQEIVITGLHNNKRFLSFPWVVNDILCEIRSEQSRNQPSRVLVNIGESALELFKKHSSPLLKNITEKLKVMKDVENCIERFCSATYKIKKGFVVTAYGSTSIFVCEPESDMDICVYPKQKVYNSSILPDAMKYKLRELPEVAVHRHFLQFVVSRAVDTITSEKREILDAKVPIVKCTVGDHENPIKCDISMNTIGLLKTKYIHHLYSMNPCYLPLFWVLVRWARSVGLVKSSLDQQTSVLDTADFYALIIYLLNCPPCDHLEVSAPSRWTGIKYLYQQLDKIRLDGIHSLGRMINTFFRKASQLEGNVIIAWPIPDITNVLLDESCIKMVATYACNAFHCLSATRNVETLQLHCLASSSSMKEFSKLLPLSVSYAIGKAHAFHAARLTLVTGAVVTISSVEGKNNLFLRAEGTQLAIYNLRNELRSLLHTNKALVLGRLPQQTSRYFMEGSSIILSKNNANIDSHLFFLPSFGAFELLHDARERMAVYLKNKEDDDSWKEKELERFFSHIFTQMEKFPFDNEILKNSLEVTVRFGCFYLVDVSSRLPDAQNSISLRELQIAIGKGRRSRKAWKRGEFTANFAPDGRHLYEPTAAEAR